MHFVHTQLADGQLYSRNILLQWNGAYMTPSHSLNIKNRKAYDGEMLSIIQNSIQKYDVS